MRRLAIALVCACNVGPKYHRPSAPVPHAGQYKEGWKLATPSDAMLRGKWWQVFREPELDALEDRVAVENQTIKQAFEMYMAARAQIGEARAGYFPTVTASPGVTVAHSSGTGGLGGATGSTAAAGMTPTTSGGSGHVTSYTAPIEASWAPDLFGRVRNAVRQAEYGAQMSAADLESQRLLEHATLAETYFQVRGQDALLALLEATVEADARILEVTRTRYATGIDTEVAVAQAEQTLQAARVQAIDAQILRAQYEHGIATLLGVPASDFSIPKRALLAMPPPIPTGTPSRLLERRPDVASAERKMAQANAALGIGYAAYFPTLTLTGSAGFASTALDTLFSWPSRVWAVGANLAETVFDGGLRGATIAQDRALYNAAVAGYRQTVLTAFQQVEDGLAQTRILAQVIAQEQLNVAAAQRAFELEKVRYETGLDPYLNLMTQQTILLAAQQALVNFEVQQMTATVMLVEALGGGWDVSELPSPSEVSRKPSRGAQPTPSANAR